MTPAPRPVVGITCYEEEAAWGSWRQEAALLPLSYVRAVVRAGGIPVLVPPQRLSADQADALVARLDALVVAGGPDVDPARYGAGAHASTVVARGERDALELAAVEAAVAGEVPALAICRGLQVLNVARGGTLIQHLPDCVGHDGHSPVASGYGRHEVHVAAGSQLARLVPWSSAEVPTHHHQAIDRLGDGLVASAHADDGVIEALEDPSVPFLVGVQWHPEAGEDPALFEALLAAARERAALRGGGGS